MNWFIAIGVFTFLGLLFIPIIKFALYMMDQAEYHMRMTGNRRTKPRVFYDCYGNVWCPAMDNEGDDKH